MKEHNCKVCGTEDKDRFYASNKSKCKKCASTEARDRYRNLSKEKKERYRSQVVSWMNNNFVKAKVDQCKRRAIRKGFDFNITEEYINKMYEHQNGRCKASGVKMTQEVGSYRGAMSIDRINPDKGYIFGNIQLLCAAVNRMKADMTQGEFIKLTKLIANNSRTLDK